MKVDQGHISPRSCVMIGLVNSPPRPIGENISLVEDTRIAAFETAENQFVFDAESEGPYQVHVQLLYRRAYQQLMEWKGWEDPDILMEEALIDVNP